MIPPVCYLFIVFEKMLLYDIIISRTALFEHYFLLKKKPPLPFHDNDGLKIFLRFPFYKE